jgi:rare lipoprotein A (peptidoglycan hydrolase)
MRAHSLRLLAALSLSVPCLASPALAGATTPSATPAATAGSAQDGWSESGEASWYGPRHEGKRTTSSERFDSHKMTAAHPTLPLGSYVRVTMEGTGRSVVVKVNDREPPHGVRCIDLSRAAAAKLGFVGRGVADVTLAPASADEAVEVAEAPAPVRHRHHRK